MSNAGSCLLHAGKRDEAEDMLRKALAVNPNDAGALLSMGGGARRGGQFGVAGLGRRARGRQLLLALREPALVLNAGSQSGSHLGFHAESHAEPHAG